MKIIRMLAILLSLSYSQTVFALNQSTEEKITQIIHGYVDAWNHRAGRGFADNCAENSDFVNIFGMHFHGKEEIQQRHNEILDTFLKNSTFTITDIELREINPNLVLGFVRWKVDGFHKPGTQEDDPGETITGIFSHVFVNTNDSWEITSTQNTLSK